jgi:hypothetical protein
MPCFSLEFRLCGKKPRERERYNRERERERERERYETSYDFGGLPAV